MADILQKGLSLQVEADDLASDTLSALADQIDELEARFTTAFEAMATAGEDAASSLEESAGVFIPEWISELEALQTASDAAFSGMSSAATSAVAGIAGSASDMVTAWTGATDEMKAGSETGASSLAGLQGEMEDTAGVAATTATEIAGSYNGDALGFDSGNGSLAALQEQMDATAGVAGETAGTIADAYDASALGLDASNGSLLALQGGFDETATLADTSAGLVSGYWDADSLGLDGGAASLKELQGAMDATVATAKADAAEIAAAFSGADLGVAGAGAGEAGAGAGAGAASSGKKSGLGLPSTSTLLTSGILAAIGLGGESAAISQLEGLESLKAVGGGSWTQTLETAGTAKGLGMSTQTIQTLIQRLDKNIGTLDQKQVQSATVEGTPMKMGDLTGINPATLISAMSSSSTSALALKSLGISSPQALMGMSPQDQLALIATKLDDIKNATLKNTITGELFGRGTSAALLVQEFATASASAKSQLPAGLAKDLQTTLGKGGAGVALQQQEFYLEVEVSAALIQVAPLLTKILGEVTRHTQLLIDLGLAIVGLKVGGKTLSTAEKVFNVGKKVLGYGGAGAAGAGAAGAAEGAGGLGAIDLLGPAGIALGALQATGHLQSNTSNDTSAFALDWQKYVAPHTGKGSTVKTTGFSTKDTAAAIAQAAQLFGINAKAMMADSFAEATLRPTAHNKSGATGPFQFMPSTWATDTKQLTGASLPIADATNPYMASFIAAAEMSKGGIGKEKSNKGALTDIVTNFENPGAKGVAGDMSRGVPFLQQMATDTTTKAPKIKTDIDTMLLDLVKSAQTHGKDFSAANDKMLKETETLLETHKGPMTTIGKELLQGLEQGLQNEKPALMGEARSIANEIEATIRAALKTHSPSELTAEIGEDLMAGLGMGMQRASGGAAAVAAAASRQVASALGGGPGAGGAPGGGSQTIIIELDGRTLVQYVQEQMHANTKLLAKFN
jgi:hypothetical protein